MSGQTKGCTEVTIRVIVRAVRTASQNLKLQEKGIDPDMIGMH